MKHIMLFIVAPVAIMGMSPAFADSASEDWNSSMSYRTASENSYLFNSAQALYLLRGGYTGQTVTYCQTAGACQNGDGATNWNGVNVIDVSGDDVTIDIDNDADSTQTAVSLGITGGSTDIGNISF